MVVSGSAGLCVFMADVYMEAPSGDGDQRPHELHRFLVHGPDGRRLESVAEKRQALFWCCDTCGQCAAFIVPGCRFCNYRHHYELVGEGNVSRYKFSIMYLYSGWAQEMEEHRPCTYQHKQ